MPNDEPFPVRADHLPSGDLVAEKLGWQAETWGGYLLVAGAWCLAQESDPFPIPALGLALLATGVSLLVWANRRRANRTAVCLRRERVGIYRRGALDMEVAHTDVVRCRTSLIKTAELSLGPCVGVLLGLLPIVERLKAPSGSVPLIDVAAGAGLVLASVLSWTGLIVPRHVWRNLELPRRSKVWAVESFRVSREQARQMGWP